MREQWRKEQVKLDAKHLVFLDETGLNTKMARLYGWASRSQRCVDYVPYGHWQSSTFIAALRYDKITAPMLFDGPMNGDTFVQYIKKVLAPTLNENDIVICDNLPAHKVKGVAESIEQQGAKLKYLPPYSPDFNPIEMVFSKFKAHIRTLPNRTLSQLIESSKIALERFTTQHCKNFFKHANYAAI